MSSTFCVPCSLSRRPQLRLGASMAETSPLCGRKRRRGHSRHVKRANGTEDPMIRCDDSVRHIDVNQKGRILVRVQLDESGNGDMGPLAVALRGRPDPLHLGPLTRVGYATCFRGSTVKSTKNVTIRHIDRIRGTCNLFKNLHVLHVVLNL